LERLFELHSDHGLTLVFVSPNMEDMAELVDRIYVMDDGRAVMSGTTREIFSQPEKLRQHGLGVPQVTEVAHALSARDIAVERIPVTVEEGVEEVWKILNS
jgi:energy-coupling factor transport system ATP-binding protein